MPLDLYRLRNSPYFTDFRDRGENEKDLFSVDMPNGWKEVLFGPWRVFSCGEILPDQGWKIHVTSTISDCQLVQRIVSDYCFLNRVEFKMLASRSLLRAQNSKYASRVSSGKFMVLYPKDEDALVAILDDLGESLRRFSGPYILTDARWGKGPLFVRYGAFRRMSFSNEWGDDVPALYGDDGKLVPDERQPYFYVPPWVSIPERLDSGLNRFTDAVSFPFSIVEALHFSNGGGVYRATGASDGLPCILKEARPFAGLDSLDRDAVDRLRDEFGALQALAGVPGVVQAHGFFKAWEHSFLAMEFVQGESFQSWISSNSPTIRYSSDSSQTRLYANRSVQLLYELDKILRRVHENGWIHGDVQPRNIMIGSQGELVLIDFEQASRVENPKLLGLGVPGFVPPGNIGRRASIESDRFALGIVGLWCFTPYARMIAYHPEKLNAVLEEVQRSFGVPDQWVSMIRDLLGIPGCGEEFSAHDGLSLEALAAVRKSLVARLSSKREKSTTPADEGSVGFPSDVFRFISGGEGIASGDAGVLDVIRGDLSVETEAMFDRVESAAKDMQCSGLLCGLGGVAWALSRAGRKAGARQLYEKALDLALNSNDLSLCSGSSGLVLCILTEVESRFDPRLDALLHLVERMPEGAVRPADTVTGESAGWAEGWSGPAIAAARLARIVRSRELRELAKDFLARDLRCTDSFEGMTLVRDEGLLLPYLARGSAGLLVAATEVERAGALLPEGLIDGLSRAVSVVQTSEPGLLDGVIGLASASLHRRACGFKIDLQMVKRQLRFASGFAVSDGLGEMLMGRRLMALSADMASGSAGWIAAFDALRSGSSPLPAHGPLKVGLVE